MLSKKDIEKELGKGICISPLIPKNIKENSVNFSIGHHAWALGSGSVQIGRHDEFVMAPHDSTKQKYPIRAGGCAIVEHKGIQHLILLPHVTTIVETQEVIGLGNYIGGTIHSKVGIVAMGIGHIGTMMGPCFCGHLMISLHNITNRVISIPVGETFISLVFHYLDSPSQNRRNSNISGHVDKLAELGIHIDSHSRDVLTEDWKCNFDGICENMTASQSYRDYRKQILKNKLKAVRSLLNIHNLVVALCLVFVAWFLSVLTSKLDVQYNTTVWTERYWTVILAAIIVPGVSSIFKLFKQR